MSTKKSSVRAFLDTHFRHFNARETVDAARAYEDHVDAGGAMLVSMAGAMSTGELGIILSRMIREDKAHAISCTGANLEEDLFNLVAHDEYRVVADWRALSSADEKRLYDSGYNRVTDTCIPETVMRHIERHLIGLWSRAAAAGERKLPSEFLFDLLGSGALEDHYQIDPAGSWLIAAMEKGIPVWSPGWEDSTTGNIFAASVMSGRVASHLCVKTGTEQFQAVMEWYEGACNKGEDKPSVGFFQIGGGIAGDFAICAVPCLIQDLKREDTPFWGYFAQVGDAPASYGGYSGAVPNEKITWGKLEVDTPKFMIQSDASIVAPLVFGYVLGE